MTLKKVKVVSFAPYVLIDSLIIVTPFDSLFISETKTDAFFHDQLFQVESYRLECRDRNACGGGIASFIRSDIPAKRRKNLETTQTESIIYEVNINSKMSHTVCLYETNFSDEWNLLTETLYLFG